MTAPTAAFSLPGDRILRAVARYHLLTRSQLTRLLYRPASTTFVGEHLTRLTRDGYLRMARLPLTTPVGGARAYWTLTPRGRRHLLSLGIDAPSPPKGAPTLAPIHLGHLLDLNDALIALELLCRAAPRLAIEGLRHERELRRAAPKVVLPDGRAASVIPDAWVDLAVDGARMGVALELDRGTEDERQWRRKVAGLVALAAGPYRGAFAADSMTVAVLVTGGPGRVTALRRWTEAELVQLGKGHWGELFWFAPAEPATADPAALFLGRCWIRPFDPTPRPLIASA